MLDLIVQDRQAAPRLRSERGAGPTTASISLSCASIVLRWRCRTKGSVPESVEHSWVSLKSEDEEVEMSTAFGGDEERSSRRRAG